MYLIFGSGISRREHAQHTRLVNRRDAGGRTPLHRTASSIEPPKDLTLLVKDDQTDKALTFGWRDLGYIKFIVDVTKVSVRNGFSKATFEGALASHIACYNPRGEGMVGFFRNSFAK
ncbi:hypothetical protein MPTK1_4g03260 [Marchantia polymorpha subsp. ruderalis]